MFLFSFLIPFHFSSAVYIPSIGSQSNPIYIQVNQDPTQAWRDAWNKLNSIQYVSACSSIYKTINSQSASSVDMSDSANIIREANYLNYLYSSYQSCVGRAAQTQSQTCPNGTGLRNGFCVSQDRICEIDLGMGFEWSGTYGSNGSAVCSCKDGYFSQNGKCIAVQLTQTNNSELPFGCSSTQGYSVTNGVPCNGTRSTKTNDQICVEDFGINSLWTNELNDTGGPICGCEIGFEWNSDGTACIVIAKTKTVTPEIKNEAEEKTMQNEGKGDSSIVKEPDTANLGQRPTPASEEVKPKSFWTRFMGFIFGF